jgi:hypothetical protein
MIKKLTKLTTLALLCAAAPAFADVYEASFEGNWYNAQQSGRGLMVDYIPIPASGAGQYFMALFSYDNTGAPIWLTLSPTGKEGQRLFRNVEVRLLRGGTFGNTFTPPTPAGGTVVGTATVDLASCNSMKIDISTTATNLSNVNFTFTRLEDVVAGANSVAQACPFRSTFTACPSGTTAVAGEDRVCEIPAGTISSNLRLSNDASYVLGGRVAVGAAMATNGTIGAVANLTIEPGTIIRGKAGALSRLIINPGSKIFAEGTPTAPIVFTGPSETGPAEQGSWGGLILAGRAPINANCTGSGNTTCAFEADAGVIWGGTDANDDSGVLKFVQIRSAGAVVTPPDKDLNALTLGAVGSGTVISHVQAHNGSDDGFEMFGGTVNMTYLVATGNDDDAFDTDFGYIGKTQYFYQRSDSGSVADSQGIESDNGPGGSNFDALPRTRPVLVNATFDGADLGNDAFRIRRGSGFVLQNVVAYGWRANCINFNDAATYTAAVTGTLSAATNLTGSLLISGSQMACTKNFDDVATDPFAISNWFNLQSNNGTSTNAAAIVRDGRFPLANSMLRTGATRATDAFFDNSSVKGAFTDGDWAAGWTTGLR